MPKSYSGLRTGPQPISWKSLHTPLSPAPPIRLLLAPTAHRFPGVLVRPPPARGAFAPMSQLPGYAAADRARPPIWSPASGLAPSVNACRQTAPLSLDSAASCCARKPYWFCVSSCHSRAELYRQVVTVPRRRTPAARRPVGRRCRLPGRKRGGGMGACAAGMGGAM